MKGEVKIDKWKSYHIFYFDPLLQEKLICKFIGPLMNDYLISGKIEKWFYIRYWEGGPHIRLRFIGNENIEKEIFENLEKYIYENKSKILLKKEEYYENHTFDGEKLNINELPWYGDNKIIKMNYVREYERYGGKSTIILCENFFMSSSKVSVKVIDFTQNDLKKRISISINLIMILLKQLDINMFYFFENYKNIWDNYFQNEESESSYIKKINLKKRIENLEKNMTENNFYLEWVNLIIKDIEPIKNNYKSDINKFYRIVISLIHMLNNRLGIVPEMERQISNQFIKEMLEVGNDLENKQR